MLRRIDWKKLRALYVFTSYYNAVLPRVSYCGAIVCKKTLDVHGKMFITPKVKSAADELTDVVDPFCWNSNVYHRLPRVSAARICFAAAKQNVTHQYKQGGVSCYL